MWDGGRGSTPSPRVQPWRSPTVSFRELPGPRAKTRRCTRRCSAASADRLPYCLRRPPCASSVNKSSAAKRPVLPQGFLETDHHVFGIQTRTLRQGANDVGQDLLLHFDAAPHREKYFNQDEIVCAASGQIRVLRIKTEVIRVELQNALKPVLLGHARCDQRAMHGTENRGLEFGGLAFADGECD